MSKKKKRTQSLTTLPWRMTNHTYTLYCTFGQAALESEPGSETFEAAVEGLRMLPGYPGPASGGDGLKFQPIIVDTVSNLRLN